MLGELGEGGGRKSGNAGPKGSFPVLARSFPPRSLPRLPVIPSVPAIPVSAPAIAVRAPLHHPRSPLRSGATWGAPEPADVQLQIAWKRGMGPTDADVRRRVHDE